MSEKADDLRFYEALRARVEHEDGLIVQRIAWFMASQSFLFTAYAIALNGPPSAGKLLRLVPWIGLLTSLLIYAGVFAALRAIRWLRASFETRGLAEERLGLPLLLTPLGIRRFGHAAPVLLPGAYLLAWTYLLLA